MVLEPAVAVDVVTEPDGVYASDWKPRNSYTMQPTLVMPPMPPLSPRHLLVYIPFHTRGLTFLIILLHHIKAPRGVDRLLCGATRVPASPVQRIKVISRIFLFVTPVIVCKLSWIRPAKLAFRLPAENIGQVSLFVLGDGPAAPCDLLYNAEWLGAGGW